MTPLSASSSCSLAPSEQTLLRSSFTKTPTMILGTRTSSSSQQSNRRRSSSFFLPKAAHARASSSSSSSKSEQPKASSSSSRKKTKKASLPSFASEEKRNLKLSLLLLLLLCHERWRCRVGAVVVVGVIVLKTRVAATMCGRPASRWMRGTTLYSSESFWTRRNRWCGRTIIIIIIIIIIIMVTVR